MKTIITAMFILSTTWLRAQERENLTIATPDHQTTTLTFEQLTSFTVHSIDSLRIFNHAGKYRSTVKGIKGVQLKEVLSNTPLGDSSPKVLSEYYIVCIAADGYKVIFSWNELFNTSVGDSVLIVTDIKEVTDGEQENNLALLSAQDIATGRRYVKQLETIKILRERT